MISNNMLVFHVQFMSFQGLQIYAHTILYSSFKKWYLYCIRIVYMIILAFFINRVYMFIVVMQCFNAKLFYSLVSKLYLGRNTNSTT